MYNAGKIITGIIIFLILLTFPIWYITASGKASYVPQPQVAATEKQCVETTEYMKENHMVLLSKWRERVVRNGIRTYVASNGKEYDDISLSGTCLSNCHPNKAEFCDQCHNYAKVAPNCWDCHTSRE